MCFDPKSYQGALSPNMFMARQTFDTHADTPVENMNISHDSKSLHAAEEFKQKTSVKFWLSAVCRASVRPYTSFETQCIK